MRIYLFTDFGATDLYIGQVKSVLHEYAPNATAIDLLHEAPVFNVRASAHLLAALSRWIPSGSVTLAVVDPDVGGAREPVLMLTDGRWFVAPDNGLLSVVAARAKATRIFPITWRPAELSASFHGRDVFAPCAGMLAGGVLDAAQLRPKAGLDVSFGGGDLPEVIYIDHYGNAMTGLRADNFAPEARLVVGRQPVGHARVFCAVTEGEAFWYRNSLGLVEIAANRASAARMLKIGVGDPVSMHP
jgi:S-adenosyl-L-methionine hydrolase (adenosine-forming)